MKRRPGVEVPAPERGRGSCLDSALLVHDRIAEQASRTPSHTAWSSGIHQLSYADLDRRAHELARYLSSLGVGPEKIVAICLDRSEELVVSIIAVLKAGGCYLPLDPAYPATRLASMLGETKALILITEPRRADTFAGFAGRLIHPGRESELACRGGDGVPLERASAANPAYVIFTSGSSGKPKGVVVTHDALRNHATAIASRLGLSACDRVLQFASIGFDVAAEELFPSWISGSTVIAWPGSPSPSSSEFSRFIAEQGVTVLNLPSPFWHAWIAGLSPTDAGALASLRVVVVGSDLVLMDDLARWRNMVGPAARCFNAYGLTEATITTTLYEVGLGPWGDRAVSVPIGTPISNAEVYVLDPQLDPVGTGEEGELFIGGAGLARGYQNQPDATAERFLPHPFSELPGKRMYRTGDRVRCLVDGNLEFRGRLDDQLKIRGYRVEAGDVEATALSHPGIKEAVVLARGDGAERCLVAYLVTVDPPPTARELRTFFAEQLPPYMVPAALVFISDKLPRTTSTKLDREALRALPLGGPWSRETFVAPRTSLERTLAGIWSDVLGLPDIGVDDDFFEMGGQSLLAMKAGARIMGALGTELPVTSLFEAPTVAKLAEHIDRRNGSDRLKLPPLPTPHPDEPIPLAFPQEAVWFLDQLTPGNVAYNTQVTVRFDGRLDIDCLDRTLSEILRRHEILRTSFPARYGQPVQVVHPPWQVRLPVTDLSALPWSERSAIAEKLIVDELNRPFDLTAVPLVRWSLTRLDWDDHVFVFVEHHLVHDGWSLNNFLREVQAIYASFLLGRPSPLPEPVCQFAHFALWQRELMKRGDLVEELATYWCKRLQDAPLALELHTDHPRPPFLGSQGAAEVFELAPDLSEDLRSLGRRAGTTLFMTTLAAFTLLLHRYTGQSDLLVGTGVANRRLHQFETLLGMLVNTVVIRTDCGGDPSFLELLRRVRDSVVGAQAHQDLPFQKIVQRLQRRRDMSRNPVFQVMFSFHDSEEPDLDLPGATAELEYRKNSSAKMDLNVVLYPRAEQHRNSPRWRQKGILIEWEYNTDLFEKETILRMVNHFTGLLEAVVENPERALSRFPLLSTSEHEEMVRHGDPTSEGRSKRPRVMKRDPPSTQPRAHRGPAF
jgi:amino acid adenylation domain-containing protein